VPPLELDVDVGPGVVHEHFQAHEGVVEDNGSQHENRENSERNKHLCAPVFVADYS
jgi:hypothetical protein